MIEMVLLANTLIQSLANLKWSVRRPRKEEEEGSGRIDLIVTDPNGKVFLVECKGGEEPMHFATIAQLEQAAHELSEEQGEAITPILLTTQGVRPTLSEIADKVGVELVEASGSAQEAAESVVHRLEAAQ